jgi:methyltransferase (TIGR00027 family)
MTAWWTAAARARESRRPDRLFDDPWAAVLAGRQTVDAFDRTLADLGPGTGDLYAVITRFFDDFLLRATGAGGIGQVVLVAAGLDARAFRLPWPPRTRLFELDQPRVVSYKNCLLSLAGAAPGCVRHAVEVDLGEPWTDALCRAGFDPAERSVWLLEGFLYFLAEPAVRALLETMTGLAAPGSRLGADIVNGAMLTAPSTRHWSDRMAAAGAPWLFTSDEPEAVLADFGWSATVVQPGEDGAGFGRFPDPGAHRSASGVPRSFLVTATRINPTPFIPACHSP